MSTYNNWQVTKKIYYSAAWPSFRPKRTRMCVFSRSLFSRGKRKYNGFSTRWWSSAPQTSCYTVMRERKHRVCNNGENSLFVVPQNLFVKCQCERIACVCQLSVYVRLGIMFCVRVKITPFSHMATSFNAVIRGKINLAEASAKRWNETDTWHWNAASVSSREALGRCESQKEAHRGRQWVEDAVTSLHALSCGIGALSQHCGRGALSIGTIVFPPRALTNSRLTHRPDSCETSKRTFTVGSFLHVASRVSAVDKVINRPVMALSSSSKIAGHK